MASEKEKYAQMISQSELFSLDSKSEPSAYHRELLRMIENLYCYLMSFGREKYENYGLEITETAKRCIRNYDESQGPFLPYFVSAWKYEFSHITSDRMLDERLHGIRISEDDRRSVVRYIRLINSMEANLSLQEVFQRLSDSMGLPIKDIERIALIEGITISSDIVMDIDGNSQQQIQRKRRYMICLTTHQISSFKNPEAFPLFSCLILAAPCLRTVISTS